MNVLVTGGEGYLGHCLCKRLVADGHSVVSWDTGWFSGHVERIPGVSYHRGDVTEIEELSGFDGVAHLANFSCDPMADLMPSQCFGTNVGGTFHVAKLAKRDGVPRFIFASTASVYGLATGAVDEYGSTDNVTSYYGASKVAAERVLHNLADQDFAVSCIRKGTLGGVSPRMRMDLMVNTMAMFAVDPEHKRITVSNPNIVRPHLDIRDAVALYNWALTRTQPLRGIYNAAISNHTVLDVAKAIQAQTNCSLQVQQKWDNRSYALNCTKLEREGFKLHFELSATIERVLSWLRANAANDPLNDDRLFNIRVYRNLEHVKSLSGR